MPEIVLARAGHYFDAVIGSCRTATVACVHEDRNRTPGSVNLSVLEHSGRAFELTSVPVNEAPELGDTTSSFHLTRSCPWGR